MNSKNEPDIGRLLREYIETMRGLGQTVAAKPDTDNLNNYLFALQGSLQVILEVRHPSLMSPQQSASLVWQLQERASEDLNLWLDQKTPQHRSMITNAIFTIDQLQTYVAKTWPELEKEQIGGAQPSKAFNLFLADIFERTVAQFLQDKDIAGLSDLRIQAVGAPHLRKLLLLAMETEGKYAVNITEANTGVRLGLLFDLTADETTVAINYATDGKKLAADMLMPIKDFVDSLEEASYPGSGTFLKSSSKNEYTPAMAWSLATLLRAIHSGQDPDAPQKTKDHAGALDRTYAARLAKLQS